MLPAAGILAVQNRGKRLVERANGSPPSVRILFLGQCLQYGYGRISGQTTFPRLAASMLRSRFPGLSFKFDLKYLYHPLGLKPILKHRLRFSPPDVVIITLPAMFAATSWRVNRIYEMAPELVDTARSLLQKMETTLHRIEHPRTATTLLDKAFAIRRPMPVDEYERVVQDAVEHCRQTSPCRFALMGPGRFNEDTIEDYAVHSPELWRSVNEMALRLGRRLNVPVINAQEALEEHGSEVFITNNHRWSVYGHEVIAGEVESLIASQVIELGRGK
ncbi:MAG TPA: hypothetical protein VLM38_04355 [Blastocatellia bacterium]|nr:hypothetical protein [Blastocatellia bacterium]